VLNSSIDIRWKGLVLLAMDSRLDFQNSSNAEITASSIRKSSSVRGAIERNVEVGSSISRIRPTKFVNRVRPALDNTLDTYVFVEFFIFDTMTPDTLKVSHILKNYHRLSFESNRCGAPTILV